MIGGFYNGDTITNKTCLFRKRKCLRYFLLHVKMNVITRHAKLTDGRNDRYI